MKKDYHIPLEPGKMYHLFSRAHGQEKMFRDDINYAFFLKQMKRYVLPVVDIHAYCLLPNHFHLLAEVRDEEAIREHYQLMKRKAAPAVNRLPDFIMERFSNFLNSYAKSFNKWYHRKGGLFMDYMRRVEIKDKAQLWTIVFYIHNNPVKHGYCGTLQQWSWSSYTDYLNPRSSWIRRKKVIDCYGGKDSFCLFHRQPSSHLLEELDPV